MQRSFVQVSLLILGILCLFACNSKEKAPLADPAAQAIAEPALVDPLKETAEVEEIEPPVSADAAVKAARIAQIDEELQLPVSADDAAFMARYEDIQSELELQIRPLPEDGDDNDLERLIARGCSMREMNQNMRRHTMITLHQLSIVVKVAEKNVLELELELGGKKFFLDVLLPLSSD